MVPVCGDGPGGELGHQRQAVDVGGLALVGGHAERGVALEVLDRAEALVPGERHVVVGDVVLQVDEGLAARAAHAPQRRRRPCSRGRRRGCRRAGRSTPQSAAACRPGRWRRRPGRPPGRARRWRRRPRSCRAAACRARRRQGDRSRPAGRPDARSDAPTGSSRPTRTRDRNRCARSLRRRSAPRPRAHAVEPSARVTAPPAISRAPAALAAASMLPGTARARIDDAPRRRCRRGRGRRPCAPSRRCWRTPPRAGPGATA